MRVRDLMRTEVVTLTAHDHLDLAEEIMRKGRIRHMPVVSGEAVVGMVSQRDLFRAGVSSALQFRASAEREWLAKISVREVMTPDVVSIGPDVPAAEAVKQMLDRRIGCLPVIDEGRLVGLLSETDCMRYLARLLDIAATKQDLPGLQE
jgi:acetoin utilization protein AcuB